VSITECFFNGVESSSVINIQDFQYVTIDKCEGWGNQGNGISIVGNSIQVTISNCNIGPYSSHNGSSLLIGDSGGNSPTDIYVTNSVFQGGNYSQIVGVSIARVSITNCAFEWGQSHGLYFGTSATQITVANCVFWNNAQGGNAGIYDLCFNCSGRILVSGCVFGSAVGTTTGTVIASAAFLGGASTVTGCNFTGGNGTAYSTRPTQASGNLGDTGSNNPKVFNASALATITPADDAVWRIIPGTTITFNVTGAGNVTVSGFAQGVISAASVAGNARLQVGVYLDGAAQTALAVYYLITLNNGYGSSGTIGGIWSFAGLAPGSHTCSLGYWWNGTASAATISQATISALVDV
jgi:hypothetical protein